MLTHGHSDLYLYGLKDASEKNHKKSDLYLVWCFSFKGVFTRLFNFHLIWMATVPLQGDMHLPRAKAAQNLSQKTFKLPQNQLLSFYNGVEFNYIFPASRRGL